MARFITTYLFIFFGKIIFGQPCNFPFQASNTCLTAPLVCTLDGYCSSNTGSTNTGTPNAFCGIVENNSWVSFIAGSTTFELQITVDNCQNNSGLQAQFLSSSDCNTYTSVSNCLDPVFGTANLVCSNLTIGEIYYLMMDGKNGDVCDYKYELVSGEILSPADVFISSVDTLCPNQSLVLDAVAISPNSNLTYQWSTTFGNIISNPQSSFVEVDAQGVYEVLVEDDQGCSATTQVDVIEPAEHFIFISVPDTLDCVDNVTETLSVYMDPPNGLLFLFTWTTTNGNIVSGANSDFPIVDQPGWYYLSVTNNWGCEKIDSVEVFADINTPVADAGMDAELNCLVSSLNLGATLSSLGTNFTYQWTTTNGNIVSDTNSLTPLVDAPGIYQLLVTNSINGCTASDEAEVFLNDDEPTDANIQVKQPCFGETNGSIFIESVIGGIPPYEYAFDGVNFGSVDEKDFLPADDYEIVIRDATGCEWSTIITIVPQPELLVDLGKDQVFILGCEADLQVITNYPEEWIDTVIWNPAFPCTAPCLDNTVKPLNETTFKVEVIDINGCLERDTVTYRIQKNRHVFIPNAFTPNDDGINDHFVVYGGKDVAKIKTFRVFDRWGELLLEQENFQPNLDIYGWDGKLDNRRMNENVFIYYVEVLFIDGWEEVFTGDVVLHR